jgi:CHASE2 domain-containing sensor protein
MTIDDADLKEYGLNWPVPLDYYQRLLDSIVKRKPKAIFLDVLFLDDKPMRDVERLVGAACRATEAGVPVFLATVSPDASRSNPERQLFSARTGADAPCLIAVRPIVTPDELDQSQWAYPLRPPSAEQVKAQTAVPDSVALSLYCRLYKVSARPTHLES